MTDKTKWQTVKFGDVVRLNRDRCADPEAEGIERYVGIEHLEPEDLRIRNWGLVEEGTTFTNYFRPGQVLFVKRRAYQRKVAVAKFKGVCSGDIYVLEPKGERLLPELLPFICQTEGFFAHAVNTSAGSLSPRTNWTRLAEYEFALPPLAEQHMMTRLLRASYSIFASLQHSRATAEELRWSLATELFRYGPAGEGEFVNHRYLGRIPSHWRIEQLGKMVEEPYGIVDGPFGSNLKSVHYRESGIPVIQSGFVTSGRFEPTNYVYVDQEKFDEQKRSAVKGGDIVMAKIGEYYGTCAVFPETHPTSLLAGNCLKISPEPTELNTAYLLFLLQWLRKIGIFRRIVKTTAQPALSISELRRLEIPIPTIEVQLRIVEMIGEVNSALSSLNTRLEKSHGVYKNLLSRIFENEGAQ